MPSAKEWIVTTSGEKPLKDIAQKLTAAGFKVDRVLYEIGCITGRADAVTAGNLRSIDGVADVSKNIDVSIGPPDAEVS